MRTRGNATICTALLMIVAFGAACTNEHDASTATVVPDPVAAAHASKTEPRPLRQANVQAFDLEHDIYILDVGSDDDVREGDRLAVTVDGGEPFTVVVDKVFNNHASACAHAPNLTTDAKRLSTLR